MNETVEDLRDSDLSERERERIISGIAGLQELLYPIQIGAPVRPLTSAEVAWLEQAADKLPSEKPLTKDDVADIHRSLDALHAAIKDSTISRQAQKIFRDLIRVTESSLRFYEIHGAKALRSAFIEMLGELLNLYREQPVTDGVKTPETAWWKTAQEHVQVFGETVRKVLPYVGLLKYVIPAAIERAQDAIAQE